MTTSIPLHVCLPALFPMASKIEFEALDRTAG